MVMLKEGARWKKRFSPTVAANEGYRVKTCWLRERTSQKTKDIAAFSSANEYVATSSRLLSLRNSKEERFK